MPSPARSLLIHRTMIKSSLWFELHKGGRTMYLVKILNADHRPVDVEVSLEIYRVYEESQSRRNGSGMSAGNISKGNLLMIACCMIWLRSRWKKPPSAWKPCWKLARCWRNFPRCSGGVSFSIFSTDTPIQRLPKCRTAINRQSCVPCNPP